MVTTPIAAFGRRVRAGDYAVLSNGAPDPRILNTYAGNDRPPRGRLNQRSSKFCTPGNSRMSGALVEYIADGARPRDLCREWRESKGPAMRDPKSGSIQIFFEMDSSSCAKPDLKTAFVPASKLRFSA